MALLQCLATSGFAALVKEEAPRVIVTHSFLRRHVMTSKTVSSSEGSRVYKRENDQFCQRKGCEPLYFQLVLSRNESSVRTQIFCTTQIPKQHIQLKAKVSFFSYKVFSTLSSSP
ncbi:hypothetical protein FHG87_000839 [Trinorchestia longiramus]|nr:hypothetical protein FHG87_000839 [Trinorchestia longiramus]